MTERPSELVMTDMSLSELERRCIQRAPSFQLTVFPRGQGVTVSASWEVRGLTIHVQRALPDHEHVELWRRLILEQVLGDRGLLA